ncbi:hypothetical protein [Oceanobacillus senegalensis]|uniref:hypothetical protein n=1 Tax=Oceanobacillus senegalensis TaxID=1936063 RepID=UPI000A30EABB|nr:hypothetical protein [Oceanobacillus senegalensis]
MLFVIGMTIGIIVSFIGSFIISLIPYIPFVPVFLISILPSILVFSLVTFQTNSKSTKMKHWLTASLALFVIGLLSFGIKNYFEARAVSGNPGGGLNWDAIILFNILYSLGAAFIVSPIGYFAIRWLSHYKEGIKG